MGGSQSRRWRRLLGGCVGLALTLALATGGTAGAQAPPTVAPPDLPDDVLPGLPGAPGPEPGPVPRCRVATLACIDETIELMEQLRRTLGCDHRGVFATTYLILTRVLRDFMAEQPRFFDDSSWLIYVDSVFANFYFRYLGRDAAGSEVPAAWRIAFETAADRDANAGQDLLLGINAHVQRDLPYVYADVAVRTRTGASRKDDHDRVNEVLARAYEGVVSEIGARYDPLITTTNSGYTPADDIGGLELIRRWREGAWRNAERLVDAKTEAERDQVEIQIEANAEAWASSIASGEQPGYRAIRDAYCRANLPFAASAPSPPFAIRLAAEPGRAPTGQDVAVRFAATVSATGFDSAPVPDAEVSFGGRRTTTDRTGRASITLRRDQPGSLVAAATKSGLRPGRATVAFAAGAGSGGGPSRAGDGRGSLASDVAAATAGAAGDDAGAGAVEDAGAGGHDGSLPFTGLAAGGLAALGLGLILVGAAARRRADRLTSAASEARRRA